MQNWALKLTNDRLYESKDSREIEKGSYSPRFEVPFVDTLEGFERLGQKPFFSGGDGWVVLVVYFCKWCLSYRQIHPAIIHD